MLWVAYPGGERAAGEAVVGASETSWSFRPHARWAARPHLLVVDTRLEDRAGNSVARPFEVDLWAAPPKKRSPLRQRTFVPRRK